MSGYISDNAAERPTAQRFARLETLYDPRTIRFLEATGGGWGRSLDQRFIELGLEGVGMEGHLAVRPGGSAGALLDRANLVQVRDAAVGAGLIAAEEIDRMLALLDDPACAFASPTMFTAWGPPPVRVWAAMCSAVRGAQGRQVPTGRRSHCPA